MRIAVFGGSFNPLHVGHLFIAEEVKTELRYDKIIFVPSNISCHKEDFSKVTSSARLEMVREALEEYDYFIVDSSDIERGGVSYSIDTINHIYENYTFEEKPGFIIGDDLLKDFPTWKTADKLRELIDLIVVRRISDEKLDSNLPNYYIENTIMPVSSTEIRKRVKHGKTIKHLTPEKVRIKIIKNGYYR
ncbi:MAG: nicotinate (nicotinamide) nucleotide adenylyltransferase [Spirochaetes bacterium]|nr:nicotinate (nicotinamide) nucleotide adenylyltransferase [Spirochaetota bacterium]